MSNMIKTIKYNKVSGGRIRIAFVVFVTDDDDHNKMIRKSSNSYIRSASKPVF